MEDKVDEPFNPYLKSSHTPDGLIFRLAKPIDTDAISNLMYLRNPTMDFEGILERTKREIKYNQISEKYRIFVAELDGIVVGLSRYYHSQGIKKEKVYDAPEGFWCMGTLVKPEMRRMGIARFLTAHRFEWMKKEGVEVAYSGVAGDNKTSLRMHESFGYTKIGTGKGFHHISFDCGHGVLFKKLL